MKPQWIYTLPLDFPAQPYLTAPEPEKWKHWPFLHVPHSCKWSMRHKVAYALNCRFSVTTAEKCGWGEQFERTYTRVCECIAWRLSSDWQDRKWASLGGKTEAWEAFMTHARQKLGYIPAPADPV